MWTKPWQGPECSRELGRTLTAKLRSLGFALKEAWGRWKVLSRGKTCSSKGHRRTDWRLRAQMGAWSHGAGPGGKEGFREEVSQGGKGEEGFSEGA